MCGGNINRITQVIIFKNNSFGNILTSFEIYLRDDLKVWSLQKEKDENGVMI